MKRTAIAALALCALLAQGAAFALAGPMLPPPAVVEQGMPCHGDGATEKSATPSMPCCADECHCADFCGGHAALVVPSFSYAAPSRADFQPPRLVSLRLGFTPSSPLRPPIASPG